MFDSIYMSENMSDSSSQTISGSMSTFAGTDDELRLLVSSLKKAKRVMNYINFGFSLILVYAGYTYFNDCPAEPKLPNFLITNGILLSIVLPCYAVLNYQTLPMKKLEIIVQERKYKFLVVMYSANLSKSLESASTNDDAYLEWRLSNFQKAGLKDFYDYSAQPTLSAFLLIYVLYLIFGSFACGFCE
uniref:Uncharacterized protein n=1 Tax=Strigamia maritima TaxID=126957 RepID=T1J3Z5_STRMM